MNLPPVNDITKLLSERSETYQKYQAIKGSNIFPSLLITAIERLIIKKCFNFAFEVFFGILFETNEALQLRKSAALVKLAISEFTVAVQSRSLSNFQKLSSKQEFFELVNDMGCHYDLSEDKISLKVLKGVFKRVRVNIVISDTVIQSSDIFNDDFYTSIFILSQNSTYNILLELRDYMDDEAIAIFEKDLECKRVNESSRMALEEKQMYLFIKKSHEIETEMRKQMSLEEQLTRRFLKKERKRESSELEMIKGENSYIRRFYNEEGQAEKLNLMEIGLEEVEMKRFNLTEIQAEELNGKKLMYEDLIGAEFLATELKSRESEREIMKKEELETRLFLIQEKTKLDEERFKKEEAERLEQLKKDENLRLKNEQRYKAALKRIKLMKSEDKNKLHIDLAQIQSLHNPLSQNSTPRETDSLLEESKIIESLVLKCGSSFCTQCYRMLKRSSLFLKCSGCCDSAFTSPLPKVPLPFKKPAIAQDSRCLGCDTLFHKGEFVECICCYIKHDFLKDYSPNSCHKCSDADTTNWIDTYIGNKYELIDCGFCKRQVNYAYVVEVCTVCHDKICLHCLRKNNFIAVSICGECHSRREVNPYRISIK